MLRAITVAALAAAVLMSLWTPGYGAPKTIAIVNLSADASAPASATKVRELLNRVDGLRPTTPGDLARALEDALPEGGPDAEALAQARDELAKSTTAFTDFKSREARAHLERARSSLFGLTPTKETSRLLADVSFNMSLIHMRAENNGLAMGELQLLHRLVKQETIDPVRYPPDVVRAFKQARKVAAAKTTATVSISATYDGAPVYLDGVAAGTSPITIPLSAGAHIVSIAAPQYQATAILIDIDPGATQSHRIDLEPRNQVVRARELRFEARSNGLKDEELRVAAGRVARLVGSDAVMILIDGQSADGASQVVATLYIQHLDRLTYRHQVDKQLKNMLGLVIDVPRPTLLDGVRDLGPVPWYKKPWGIAAIGGGTAATIAALIALGSGEDPAPPRNGVPGFDFPD